MNTSTASQLRALLSQGEAVDTSGAADRWLSRVSAFLGSAIGQEAAREFNNLGANSLPMSWGERHSVRLGHLEGLLARAEDEMASSHRFGEMMDTLKHSLKDSITSGSEKEGSRSVFIVHGHDGEAKESLARFLEKIALKPIILHEQPSGGRTIIEKFETYSHGIAFAIVLLTPDDVGAAVSEKERLKCRARQNVILELGYFIGRLGRTNVRALHKGDVELPSDIQGVIYIEMDKAGGWQMKLAQELIEAKIPIELSGLVKA